MSGDRTEQPTPRRLREARRRGEVARSRDLSSAAALLSGLAAVAAAGPATAAALAGVVREGLAVAASGTAAPLGAVREALLQAARHSAIPCAAAVAGGTAAALLQAGGTFAPGALRPRLERLHLLRGLRRLASRAQLAATALAAGQAAVLLALAWAWLREEARGFASLPRASTAGAWRVGPAVLGLAFRLALATLAFGVAGHAVARRAHLRSLRMTRDEVRRERREDEGDPALRAERRRRHRGALGAAPVARATCVVVNPTHVAVALAHERSGDGAPRVVAKGTGAGAARIRSAARRAGVPIVRDVPLARALFRLAEIGEEIPEDLYEAAAAVLAHLYGLAPGEER
ncbi:MAG TPA: EscU/YscU/HrcU family type III secretion system export apparatus switch protein [Anaeromyxobacteraceae bacterium]|nr:EscU/YscU/HrcU family type III secretion system export apparatus switch protein [Anaeromyxobacteraceae bacterium]